MLHDNNITQFTVKSSSYINIQKKSKKSRLFKCSFHHAKRAFHRSLNAVYGRVGRLASEEVFIKLVSSKCLPSLLYGTEACPLLKSDLLSFDFALTVFS